jgi:hypothetical protein
MVDQGKEGTLINKKYFQLGGDTDAMSFIPLLAKYPCVAME